MKFNITGKLVAVLSLTSVLLVAAMATAIYWSFQKGFITYLTELELDRLDQTVADLGASYRIVGSWDFLRGNHEGWMEYLPLQNPRITQASPPPPPAPGLAQPGMRFPPPPAPRDRTGLSTRLRLLDADRNNIIGPPGEGGNELLRPIGLDQRTIGWLSLTPLPVPESDLDRRFRDQQLQAIYPIAGGALLLALLIGIPLGRHLLKPVKAVATGAHALARGRFDVRLDPQGGDELGRLVDDFNALAKVLERNEQLRRQSMADVSHELRTPLAILRGDIEAIQDGVRPLDQSQMARLHNTVMVLSRLVDDLYDLALVDAGALTYQRSVIDLSAIIQQAADAAEGEFAKKDIMLATDVDEGMEIFGDERRMRQVFDNLLKNSLRYTDNGGECRLTALGKKRWIYINLEDSAPGVALEELPRLFDRFYRVEASRNRSRGGAGLGLAICKTIITAHEGEIGAQASRLGGIRIHVKLPAEINDHE
ncbi:MAG: ATP-binding protein [Candidatus Thiodiazotropha sp.]|nr:HAMP domain-containing protein [Candidatus Thiodiazotropha taylori]MBV2093564.1 HAMP domain-containing protein [Candidatus Thiodiazotropha sp. (ex Codakia orbicularis)]PUB77434.1 MAG: two-component sensor histidine kinase [gamma proteobacterium symbiont of Ctena orbiculata]